MSAKTFATIQSTGRWYLDDGLRHAWNLEQGDPVKVIFPWVAQGADPVPEDIEDEVTIGITLTMKSKGRLHLDADERDIIGIDPGEGDSATIRIVAEPAAE